MLASTIHQETLAISWSEEDSKALELSSHTLGGQACLVDVLFLSQAEERLHDSCIVCGGHACLRLFSYSGRLASFAALSCIASSPSSREASPSRLDTVKPWLVRRSCGGQACLPIPLGGLSLVVSMPSLSLD